MDQSATVLNRGFIWIPAFRQRGGYLVISRTFAALAAASLVFGSGAALAQSSAPAPVAAERASASAQDASELRGTTGWVIGAIALALIIWGAIELFDDDSESP